MNFEYCPVNRDACELSYREYMKKLPVGYERGEWRPVHCANKNCHGLFFKSFDEKRCNDPRGARCKVCRVKEMSDSELKEHMESEEEARAFLKGRNTDV